MKDALGRGYPRSGGGGVDQGPWLQERVGGGRRGGWGWLLQRGASPGKGWLAWQFHRRGQGLGGKSKGFGSGRVGVLFFVTCSRGLPCAVCGSEKGWLGGARAGGCPVEWGGVPTRAGLRGGRPRRGGGVGAGWVGAWLAVAKKGSPGNGLACLAVPQEGARPRGLVTCSRRFALCCLGVRVVGARAPGTEQISQRVSYFLSFLTCTKRRKMAFFEGCPVTGGGGYPPQLAWWTGVPKRGKSREGLACLAVPQEGAGGIQGFGSGSCLGVREGLAWRGKGSGGGPRASVPGGVGGRGTGPRDGAYFCRFSRKKNDVF